MRSCVRRMARLASCLIVLACLAACLRHRPANSNCEWPNDTRAGPLDLSQRSDMQHLSEDAEFAEDLAIRYADARRGPDYLQTRGECMERLFGTVAKNHGVTGEQVRASLGRRRLSFDAAVILSFAVLYGLAASLLTRWLCRIYGPGEGLPTVAVMTVFAGLIASGVGVLLGEVLVLDMGSISAWL
jgi:hypothetical protein